MSVSINIHPTYIRKDILHCREWSFLITQTWNGFMEFCIVGTIHWKTQVWQVVFYGLDIWKRSPKRQTDIFFTTVEVCALVPVCRVICFYTPVVLIPPGAAWGKAVNQGNMSDMMSSKVFGFSVYSVCVCVWTVSPFQAVFWSGTSYALVKTVGSWVGSREWGQIWSSTCLRRTKKWKSLVNI